MPTMNYTKDFAQAAIDAYQAASVAAYEHDDLAATEAALRTAEEAERLANAQAKAAESALRGDITYSGIIADAYSIASVAKDYADKCRAAVAYVQSGIEA
jgi:hypothetical protein